MEPEELHREGIGANKTALSMMSKQNSMAWSVMSKQNSMIRDDADVMSVRTNGHGFSRFYSVSQIPVAASVLPVTSNPNV
jgi:hypothetical protein